MSGFSKDMRAEMLSDLKCSGLTAADAATMRLRVVANGYEIPYLNQRGVDTGFYRVKHLGDSLPVDKSGKTLNYTQPKNSGVRAYFSPLLRNRRWAVVVKNPKIPIYFTEGCKKASRGCKDNLACIGLGGVWNFKSNKQGVDFLPELEKINWKNREVIIIFDSDAVTNANVRAAELELAAKLKARGAIVRVIRLPSGGAGV